MYVSIYVYGTSRMCIAWLYVFVFICMYGKVVEVCYCDGCAAGSSWPTTSSSSRSTTSTPSCAARPPSRRALEPRRSPCCRSAATHKVTSICVALPFTYIHTYTAKVPSGEGIFGYFAFAAKSRVIGMGTFPLTGDPSKVRYPTLTHHPTPYLIRQRRARNSRIAPVLTQVMGIVAHPGAISSLAISSDGKFLFSAGGPDLSVNMWKVEPSFGRRLRTAESRSIEALSATVYAMLLTYKR